MHVQQVLYETSTLQYSIWQTCIQQPLYEAAEILAQLATDKPDAKVMDLAVGSGTLLVAVYRRKRELLQRVKGTVELEDHKRSLEHDLTGIDIMPFTVHLAVGHLALQALLYETEKVRVAVWDSIEPGKNYVKEKRAPSTVYASVVSGFYVG